MTASRWRSRRNCSSPHRTLRPLRSRYIEEKYQAVVDKLDKIDELISSNAKGWSIDRMSKVDLTILRLGVYEMIFDDTIPEDVALNEAIELAKEFGQDQSYSFINGVLAKLHK